MLAVGREGEVHGRKRPPGADLRGLLTLDRRPERELTLALQRRRLVAEATDDHHVAIEAEDLVAIQGGLVLGVLNAFAFGRQQLDKFFVDHRHSFGTTPAHHTTPLR